LTEYYFDIETTGFNFDEDEIITIQWQELDRFTGKPLGKLEILKRWASSEERILRHFYPNLKGYPFNFIFIGKNLSFDFCMLNKRLQHYSIGKIDLKCLHERVSLDIEPILVLMNNGNFKDYDKIMPKTNPTTNDMIPKLFKGGKYSEIVKYIADEAGDFTKMYQILKKDLVQLRNHLK
jgi:hypothetical protein